MNKPIPTLRILGIRGVPAAHGGFETFAEQLALHLVARGWRVVVYCQEDGPGATTHDEWRGIERVHIHAAAPGARGTMQFDWRAIRDAAQHRDLCLTLGYNTAMFCIWLRLRSVRNVINMDGIEWSRAKWGPIAKAWLWLNAAGVAHNRFGDDCGNLIVVRRNCALDQHQVVPRQQHKFIAHPRGQALRPFHGIGFLAATQRRQRTSVNPKRNVVEPAVVMPLEAQKFLAASNGPCNPDGGVDCLRAGDAETNQFGARHNLLQPLGQFNLGEVQRGIQLPVAGGAFDGCGYLWVAMPQHHRPLAQRKIQILILVGIHQPSALGTNIHQRVRRIRLAKFAGYASR